MLDFYLIELENQYLNIDNLDKPTWVENKNNATHIEDEFSADYIAELYASGKPVHIIVESYDK